MSVPVNCVKTTTTEPTKTSTPVRSKKNRSLDWDDLDVSMISESHLSPLESNMNRLNVTSDSKSIISLSEIYTPNFTTAWSILTYDLGNGEKLAPIPFPYEDIFELTPPNDCEDNVEAPEELNGLDCPCALNPSHVTGTDEDEFHPAQMESNQEDPGTITPEACQEHNLVTAAVKVGSDFLETNIFHKIRTTVAFTLDHVLQLSRKMTQRISESTTSFDSQTSNNNNSDNDCGKEETSSVPSISNRIDFGVDAINFCFVLNETIQPTYEKLDVFVTLNSPAERRIYKILYFLTIKEFRDFLDMENQFLSPEFRGNEPIITIQKRFQRVWDKISNHLLYLRQYLVSPHLIEDVVDHSGNEVDTEQNIPGAELVFSREFESAKLARVYEDLTYLRSDCHYHGQIMDKVVILTQFTGALELLKYQLWLRGFSADIISDDMTVPEQQFVMTQFSVDPDTPNILLLTIETFANTKWNMSEIYHLFLLDNHWDPRMDVGIYDQIHCERRAPVAVRRYICKETVEETIDDIREKKFKYLHEITQIDPTFNTLTKNEIFRLFGFYVVEENSQT